MKEKKIVITGSQGERGDNAEGFSVPVGGVIGLTNDRTPEGFVAVPTPRVITEPLTLIDSRLDILESLPAGSTTGDAEVADMRVEFNGTKKASAGEAVRDQFSNLMDYAEEKDLVQDQNIQTMICKGEAEGEYITIDDAASLPAEQYALTLSPVQSLNGYDSPWAAGAGKNLLGLTIDDFDNPLDYGLASFVEISLQNGTYTISTDAPTGYIWIGDTC